MRVRAVVTLLSLFCSASIAIAAPQTKKPKTPKDQAIEFCRAQSLLRLKYATTVEWLDRAKEEAAGVWLVSGVRTAKAPSGETDQTYTCRVSIQKGVPALKMLQLFKEHTSTGRDIFELR